MVAHALLDRQLQGGGASSRSLQRAASEAYLSSMPALLHEQEVTAKLAGSLDGAQGQVDKAFAAAWQDDSRLLVGTKCNKLLQWDTAAGSLRSVPLPAAPPRQQPPLETIWGSCGIHTVDVNPAGDMVATGGSEPSDCVVLRLPDFQPVQTLVGHMDWLFGAAWVSDRHLVTGSRDQCVALWSLPEAGSGAPEAQYQEPAAKPGGGGLQRKFEGKVRDVKYDFESCRLAALSTEPQGCIKLLDASRGLRTVRTLNLQHTKELVCMEQRADLLAVGSMGHVQLLDPRRRNPEVKAIASPDDNQGVRSVQLTDHVLSFGSGRGKLFFWDLRAGGFVPTEPARFDYGSGGLHCKLAPQPAAAWAPRQHLQLGSGLVQKNDLYWEHFAGMEVKHACYAHLWDASRTRLFVCGGPLAFGLAGCYMAVWH